MPLSFVQVSAQDMKSIGRPLRAIKVMLAEGGAAGAEFDTKELKQLHREGMITSNLIHENVCRTYVFQVGRS